MIENITLGDGVELFYKVYDENRYKLAGLKYNDYHVYIRYRYKQNANIARVFKSASLDYRPCIYDLIILYYRFESRLVYLIDDHTCISNNQIYKYELYDNIITLSV